MRRPCRRLHLLCVFCEVDRCCRVDSNQRSNAASRERRLRKLPDRDSSNQRPIFPCTEKLNFLEGFISYKEDPTSPFSSHIVSHLTATWLKMDSQKLQTSQANALVYTTLVGFGFVGIYAGYRVKGKTDFLSGLRTQSGESELKKTV